MRRHEGGTGSAPAGVVRSCTPGRTPEQSRRLLPGRLGSGHRGTRKREKPVARWTGAFLLLASALARHAPSLWGEGKRDGQTPSPTKPGADEARAVCSNACTISDPFLSVRPRASGGPWTKLADGTTGPPLARGRTAREVCTRPKSGTGMALAFSRSFHNRGCSRLPRRPNLSAGDAHRLQVETA